MECWEKDVQEFLLKVGKRCYIHFSKFFMYKIVYDLQTTLSIHQIGNCSQGILEIGRRTATEFS